VSLVLSRASATWWLKDVTTPPMNATWWPIRATGELTLGTARRTVET
jgi:hypothetical protein